MQTFFIKNKFFFETVRHYFQVYINKIQERTIKQNNKLRSQDSKREILLANQNQNLQWQHWFSLFKKIVTANQEL